MPRKPAPPRRRLDMPTHIGPWPREDYRSFKRLCTDALLLEPAEPDDYAGGLLATFRKPSAFPDVAAAERAISQHPVYEWLEKYVPRAVEFRVGETPFVRVRRARLVVEKIPYLSLPQARAERSDKRRKTARAAIERIEKGLDDGTIQLWNLAQEEMLETLLIQAKQRLAERRTKAGSAAYPYLRDLAFELREWTGSADSELLEEVIGAVGLKCDDRTASRYARAAERRRDTNSDDK